MNLKTEKKEQEIGKITSCRTKLIERTSQCESVSSWPGCISSGSSSNR